MTYLGNLSALSNKEKTYSHLDVVKPYSKSFNDLPGSENDKVYFGHEHYQQRRKFSFFRAVSNLFKGGVYDTIRGIFSLKGLIMMGVTGGLIAITGGAAIPFLAAAGIGLGGFQVFKGSAKAIALYKAGDTYGAENSFRDIGSGLSTGAMSFIGLRSAYRSGLVKTQRTVGEMTVQAKDAASSIKGTFQQLFADITGKSTVIGKNKAMFGEAFSGAQQKMKNLQIEAMKNKTGVIQQQLFADTGLKPTVARQNRSLLSEVFTSFGKKLTDFKARKFETLKTNIKTQQGRASLYQKGHAKYAKIKSNYVDTAFKDAKSLINPQNGITRSQIIKNNNVYKILKPQYDNGTLPLVGTKANQAGRNISRNNEEYEAYLRAYHAYYGNY